MPAQAQFASFNGTYPTGGVASQTVGSYQFYTYNVAATQANSYLSFTFRNDPSYTNLDTISVSLSGGPNLLQNGGLDTAVSGIPTNWVSIGTPGLSAAGVFSTSGNQAGAGHWYDGAVGGFDGIAQSLTTSIGSTYTISFYLNSDPAFNSSSVQTFAYFGALPPGLVITGGVLPATHWLGQTNSNWNATNWASDAGGTATTATPTATDDITFSATGAANQVNTNLDAAFTIKSLTVNSNTGISSAAARTLTVNQTTSVNSLLSINSNVTLQSNDSLTVSSTGTLAGAGSVTAAVNKSIFINGALSVGDATAAPGAAVLSLTTSGTGSVVMGAASTILVDLWTGAGAGDNTGIATSSDRVGLVGSTTLNAPAGTTLAIGNPAAMTGFAGGDQWLLFTGTGTIAGGAYGVNDLALGLSPTQVGNFNQTTGIYKIIDTKGGLDMANAQDQSVMSGIQGILGDINGRLFNLRAGWGEEPQDSISNSLNGGIDDGVIDENGQGDGPEQPIAKKIPRSRQWEVFATVNYANISLSSIGTQAGVNSQTWAPGMGIERHFTRHLTLGFAANLLETHQSYANGLGSMDMQGIALSAYASYVRRSFWVDLLYSWGAFDLDTDRNATGFPVANGETHASTNAVQLNGGWSFRVPAWKLVHGPIAGVDWLHVNVGSYSETGGGLGALNYASRSVDSLITRVGWSVTREFDTSFAKIAPQLRLTYERQNIDRNNGTSVNLINQPFSATTNSQAPGQDYLVAGAGVNFEFSPDFSMLWTYQGQFFRQDMQAHYGTVRFTYKF